MIGMHLREVVTEAATLREQVNAEPASGGEDVPPAGKRSHESMELHDAENSGEDSAKLPTAQTQGPAVGPVAPEAAASAPFQRAPQKPKVQEDDNRSLRMKYAYACEAKDAKTRQLELQLENRDLKMKVLEMELNQKLAEEKAKVQEMEKAMASNSDGECAHYDDAASDARSGTLSSIAAKYSFCAKLDQLAMTRDHEDGAFPTEEYETVAVNPSKETITARTNATTNYKGTILGDKSTKYPDAHKPLSDVQRVEMWACFVTDIIKVCERAHLLHVLWSFELDIAEIKVKNPFQHDAAAIGAAKAFCDKLMETQAGRVRLRQDYIDLEAIV